VLLYTTHRGSFRGVSEVSRNHSGFSLDDGCAPFQLQCFTRHTQRAVTGFCFQSKLRKCSKDLFFWSPRRKIGDLRKNLCCSVTGNFAWRSHHTHTAKVRNKQAVWKLLSKISRTAPGHTNVHTRKAFHWRLREKWNKAIIANKWYLCTIQALF